MKSYVANCAVLTLATLAGCTQGAPGGPGTQVTTANRPTYGQAEDTFNLSVPLMSSSLQQGNQLEATIGIQRAKNFDEDVALEFVDVPAGVTIEPATAVIRHGDTDARITFHATDDALVGEYIVKVMGHPTKGGDAEIEFKLAIAAKDSFTLSVPYFATSLKQGETQPLTIEIKRDKAFGQEVALQFSDLPTGVTLDPQTMVLAPGDTEAHFTLTAAEDAALGNFSIEVEGHPAKGADASQEISLTVVKK